jgi:hypothetical protein
VSRLPRDPDRGRRYGPDEFEIAVARDPRSTATRFFVASADGPIRPQDYVCAHLLRHGATCCYWTLNDCWDVLARRIAKACAGTSGPLMRAVTLGDGYRNLHRMLGSDEYAAFLQEALKQAQRPTPVWTAREASRRGPDRDLPTAKAEALRGFFTELLPHFTAAQVVAIVGLVYTGATGPSLQGMPDLTAVEGGEVVFVDVKPPGTRVSDIEQRVHDFLLGQGLRVRTCFLTERGAYPWEKRPEAEADTADGGDGSETSTRGAPDPAVAPGAAIDTGSAVTVTTATLRRCVVCGLSLSDTATYCPVCGTPARSPADTPKTCVMCGRPFLSLEAVSACGSCRYGSENARRRRITEAEEPIHEAWSRRVSDPDRAVALYRQSIHRFLDLDEDTLDSAQARKALLFVFDRLSDLLQSNGRHEEALEAVEWATSLGLLDDDDAETKSHRDALRRRRAVGAPRRPV